MDKFGDPGFVRHEALARLFALAVFRSAQPAVLPLDVEHYAQALYTYSNKVQTAAEKSGADISDLPLASIRHAIDRVARVAACVSRAVEDASAELKDAIAAYHSPRSRCMNRSSRVLPVLADIRRLNRHLMSFEQGFIDKQGLSGREWYRHLGVAPGRWLGYGATTFPGVLESFSLDNGNGAAREIERLVRALDRIAYNLAL